MMIYNMPTPSSDGTPFDWVLCVVLAFSSIGFLISVLMALRSWRKP